MLLDILTHTPRWVFVLFALLLWLGCKQLLASRASLLRITALPIAMAGLSLHGIASAFGHSPLALPAWALAAGLAAALMLTRPLPASTRYDAAARRFELPGSAAPLLLMMGVFFTKYAVGVALAFHPELTHQSPAALGIGALYGAFNGLLAARALRLWKLAMQTDRASAHAHASL